MPIIDVAMTTCKPLRPQYSEYSEGFEKLLRMSTYPLAVKMLQKEEDIPEQAKRPLKDFGYHLNTCQCFAISRRVGEMIAQTQDDMWCHEAAIGFGFTGGNISAYHEGLEFFLAGRTRYPGLTKDLATGSKWVQTFPRFEPDKYVAIVSAPLMRAGFDPDLVILYVSPAQLNVILAGIAFEWGENVPSDIAASGGCVNYVVPPIKTGRFWVSNPCLGDFALATNSPDELVFSAPISRVEQLVAAMYQNASYGVGGMPLKYQMEPEGWLPDSYAEIAKVMKMHRPV